MSGHYQGRSGQSYTRLQSQGPAVSAEMARRKFADHVGVSDTLVDFGCGTGHLLAALSAREKLGIEVNEFSREVARSIGVSTVSTPEEVSSAFADVLISHHVLEHALHPLAELRQLHRILKPGGRLVMRLPVDDWRVQRRPVPGDQDHHLYTWTPRLMGNLLVEGEFVVMECRVVAFGYPGRLTYPLGRMLPPSWFDAVAAATAVVLRRRELLVVAARPT